MKGKQQQPPALTDEKLNEIVRAAWDEFHGDTTVLESAVGALVVGRIVGWKAVRLMHSGRTFKRYEEILGVKFREVLPDLTKESDRMNGIRLAKKLGKFWQVVTAGMVSARDAAQADPA